MEAHPAISGIKTFILEMAINIIILKDKKKKGLILGHSIHVVILRINARTGTKIKGERFVLKGCVCSLENSLMASAMGCGIPDTLTLFGPFRSWI